MKRSILRYLRPLLYLAGAALVFYLSVIFCGLGLIAAAIALPVAALQERIGRFQSGTALQLFCWAWLVLVVPTFGVMPLLIASNVHWQLPLGNSLGIFTGFTLTAAYDLVVPGYQPQLVDHPFPPLSEPQLQGLGGVSLAVSTIVLWWMVRARRAVPSQNAG